MNLELEGAALILISQTKMIQVDLRHLDWADETIGQEARHAQDQ